jgi:hypothetical protein
MRRVLFGCLAVLLALTLVSGTAAYARTHVMPLMAEGHQCHDDDEDAGTSSGKVPLHQHDHALTCCIDCLGCASLANLAPDPGSSVAGLSFSSIVSYGERTSTLAGRVPHPDPDPPRPNA